jgi:methionine synthase I (cobalamin-dependent)
MGDFAKRIRKRARDVEENSNDNIKRLATGIVGAVVVETPVDTGHARANWVASISTETFDEKDVTDPVGQATIAEAVNVINGRRSEQAVHITNNVKYAPRLNDGWSAQAPKGFVQKAIHATLSAFRGWRIVK